MLTMDPLKYAEIGLSVAKGELTDHIPVSMIRELGRKIIDSGVKILLIKAGNRGAYLLSGDPITLQGRGNLDLSHGRWNNVELWCDAYKADPLKVRNTSGAGDTAAAAFLSALLNGEAPEESVKFACMAGRDSLYCTDIYEDLRNWVEMKKEIALNLVEIEKY